MMSLFQLIQRYKNILLIFLLLSSIGVIAFFSLHLQIDSQAFLHLTRSAPTTPTIPVTPPIPAIPTPVTPIATNTSINYTSVIRKLPPNAIGMDVSGYGYPSVLVNDKVEQQKLKSLGIKYMRMDLEYSIPSVSTSKIICGGKGCDTHWTGDEWIQAIKAIGAEPVVIVHYNATDAANMVQHFNKDENNYVKYWLIGNEPDMAGMDANTYSNNFNQEFDAMKAIDPTIKIGGGVAAWYDTGFLQTFLQASGSRLDFIDFHEYGQKGDTAGASGSLLHMTTGYSNDINNLRSLIQNIVPDRASDINIEVGEWELNWGGEAQDNTNFHTVWVASAMGHILSAGALSLFYADKGNALYSDPRVLTNAQNNTVSVNPDDTNPAYHGIGMFTGEGLFQGIGDTLVEASTTLPDVEIYASDNPKDIILINKNPSTRMTASIKLDSVTSGKAEVWRKDEGVPFPDPPTHLQSLYVQNSALVYTIPPYSVTTLVLETPSQTSSTFISPQVPQLQVTGLSNLVLDSKRKNMSR